MSKQKREIELFVVDIFISIQKIKEYIKPFNNANELLHSSLHWDASIRQLEVIGEALNRLLDDENFNSLAPKYFRKVVNFRNNIVHGYFGIDIDEVWNVVTINIDILEKDIKEIVKNNIDITEAIGYAIEEYKNLDDLNIVKYLINLNDK